MNKPVNSQPSLITFDDADECYRSALRRVAVILNSGTGKICKNSWLQLDDASIAKEFSESSLNSELISYLLSAPPNGNTGADRASNEVRAEHEFYGRFQLQSRANPERLHVTFNTTEVFRQWSLERLHRPYSSDEIVNAMFEKDKKSSYLTAFTNYLVKNFWHNLVHLKLQKINDLNFHEFGGDARYESDFVADNLANILLIKSYGHKVKTRGSQFPAELGKIQRLFEINRCNRVFAERALQRNEGQTELSDFLERGWRFKRQIANALSSKLLCRGAAVADIAIYFTGKLKEKDGDRGGYYYSGNVVVRLNQAYYNTGCAPYLNDPNAVGLTDERKSDIRTFYSTRVQEIVDLSATRYTSDLKNDQGLRDFASNAVLGLKDKLLQW